MQGSGSMPMRPRNKLAGRKKRSRRKLSDPSARIGAGIGEGESSSSFEKKVSLKQKLQTRIQDHIKTLPLRQRIQMRIRFQPAPGSLKARIRERQLEAEAEGDDSWDDGQESDIEEENLYDKDGNLMRQADCNHLKWQSIRPWFRHPFTRVFFCILVICCNILMYAEDPTSYSRVDATVPVIGPDVSLIFLKWPGTPGTTVLKLVGIILSVALGTFVGRSLVHHRLLRDHWKLKMFSEDKGSWVVMFFTTICVMRAIAALYNALISTNGVAFFNAYGLDDGIGITNDSFAVGSAFFTWIGDYITFFMVLDMMLQDDYTPYAMWCLRVRAVYMGKPRLYLFWITSAVVTILLIALISSNELDWDSYGQKWSTTTEMFRALLAAFIVCLDLFILAQDWNFPTFTARAIILLPGLTLSTIKGKVCGGSIVELSHKWINYTIILLVLVLDMNQLRKAVGYEPQFYGQYVGPNNRIWVITDPAVLLAQKANPNTVNFATRVAANQTGDFQLGSFYEGDSPSLRIVALLPAFFVVVAFFALLYYENPKRVINENAQQRAVEENLRIGDVAVEDVERKKKSRASKYADETELSDRRSKSSRSSNSR